MSNDVNPYQSPATAPADPPPPELESVDDGLTGGFQSARAWGLLACFGLAMSLMIAVALLYILIRQWYFADFMEQVTLLLWSDWLYVAMNSARFATAIPFLTWEYRAYRNLPALGHSRLDAKFIWVVVCWFVPIMNWFCPYQVMAELYWRSNLDDEATPADGPPTTPVKAWWATWLLGVAISIRDRLFNAPAETPTAELLLQASYVAYLVATIVSAALAIYLVRTIDHRQLLRFRQTSPQLLG
jgi:Domain of unknown function (DUF4328)